MADALLRILGAVVIQSIRLVSARHEVSDDEATTRLDILAPSPERAALLAARLAQAPCVRGVVLLEGCASNRAPEPGLGWSVGLGTKIATESIINRTGNGLPSRL